jgi:hypothetical protein
MPTRPEHLYLPRLTEDANVKEPSHVGHWTDNEQSVLRGISNGIVVDEQARVRGVSSVPDIWARPLMFQTAVQPGSQHPLRERMVQEWRGLLSLLALRTVQSYDVEIVPVPLNDGAFARSLRKLSPDEVHLEQEQAYRWTDILLIRYEGIPIGGFSPTTLVYTATEYQDALKNKSLNLQQRDQSGNKTGYLAPPTHREEREYVAEWVFNVQKRLNDGVFNHDDRHPDHRVSMAINDLLSNWLDELSNELTLGEDFDALDVRVADEYTRPDSPWSPLENYRVYQELLRPLVLDEEARAGKGRNSDLALEPTRDEVDYEEIVVLTPRIMGSNVKIWKTKRLSHLGGDARAALRSNFDAPSGTVIDTEDLSEFNSIWIRPERYFLTDMLVKAPGNEPFLAEGERELNEGGRFLLPFKKEILDFFPPGDVQDVLEPEFEDTGSGIRFTFTLPIAGEREATVEKTYRTKNAGEGEGRIEETSVPVVEIFPKYLGENWRRYYLFQGDADQVTTRPVVYSGHETNHREHMGKVGGARRKGRITEIRGDRPFPDGIEVGDASGDAWGLILVERPPQDTQGLSKTWRVGIDFGTSNTNVFRQSSTADQAERWTFDFPKYLRRLTASPYDTREEFLEAFFLPDRAVDLPIPTALRIFDDSRKEHPLLDYFIFFTTAYQLPGNVKTNIKWDEERERKTEYFLESLLLLILVETTAERIAEVQLACSYPKAFSDENLSVFKGEWERTFKKLLEGSERVLDRKQQAGATNKITIVSDDRSEIEPEYEIEGVAAGQYFADPRTIQNPKDRANIQTAAVCLDVGGGTTDISIWSEDNIAFDASVMLAGRQISRYFQRNARLRELLFSNEAAIALEEARTEPGAFAARLNIVLKQEEEQLRERLIKHSNHKEIKRLRQIIALEFGAIVFYTASLLGAVDRTDEGGGILQQVADSGIKMHWGGNAAKLITWVDFGKYDKGGVAAKMLSGVFYQALSDLDVTVKPNLLGQLQSPGHKSEAAGGLVVMESSHDAAQSNIFEMEDGAGRDADDAPDFEISGDETSTDGVVSGENIQAEGHDVAFVDSVSEHTLFENDRTRFDETSLDRLERFTEIFNTFGVRFGLFSEDMRIPLSESTRIHIADSVKGTFTEMQSKKAGSRHVEPIFVMEMKELLDLMISNRR